MNKNWNDDSYNPYNQPPPPAPAPKKRRKWPFVVGGVVLVGIIVGAANSGSAEQGFREASAPPATTIAARPTVAPPPYTPPVRQAPVTTTAPEPEGITEGTYEVGTDIAPGKYKTAGPDRSGGHCYYARLNADDGFNIIDNDLKQGQMTVTIKASDAEFETNGCKPWIKAG